jgi:integrase/recombinase XerD
VEALLESYRGYLTGERGLASQTIRCYLPHARVFLAALPDPLDAGLRNLRAEQVTTFVLHACRGRNTGSAKAVVTALRSLLRFLHVAGHVQVPLAAAAPTVAGWRLTWLPRGLTAAQVTSLLDSCGLDTVVGRRDYAILVLLARLGLRTVEVAALELDDVDWRSGELVIRGKGNRVEALPLPVAAGQALAGYLTGGRPVGASRRLFLTVCAPQTGLSAAGVQGRVARACARAGLPRLGAHRLRHALATDLLRAGAPLAEVGQVLRHGSQVSTAIYAKVDWEALRTLAQRWPAGAA